MFRCLRPRADESNEPCQRLPEHSPTATHGTDGNTDNKLLRSISEPASSSAKPHFFALRRSKTVKTRRNASFPHKSLHTPAQALANGKLGLAFSGAGFFLPYYFGILEQLLRMNIVTDSTPLAGASAGSLAIACIKSKLPFEAIRRSIHEMADNCRQHGAIKRLGICLTHILETNLPADAHELCSNGITYVAVTKAYPYPKAELVSKFDSRDDLISALLASCHLPYLSNGDMTIPFRDKHCYDGGLMDLLPCPPDATYTITVTPFPIKELHKLPAWMRNKQAHKICIAPDLFEAWPYNFQATTKLAIFPPDNAWLDSLWEKGCRDAVMYAQAAGLVEGADPLAAQPFWLMSARKTEAVASSDEVVAVQEVGLVSAADSGSAGSSAGEGAGAGVPAEHVEYRQTDVPGEYQEVVDDRDAQARPDVEEVAERLQDVVHSK